MRTRKQSEKSSRRRFSATKRFSPPKARGSCRTIAVDFDGVIADYDGWKGRGVLGLPRMLSKRCTNFMWKAGKSSSTRHGARRKSVRISPSTEFPTTRLTAIPTIPPLERNPLPTFTGTIEPSSIQVTHAGTSNSFDVSALGADENSRTTAESISERQAAISVSRLHR